jgi:hypothetical protein
MARVGSYDFPEDLAALATERDDRGNPVRSARTVSRWIFQGPPKLLQDLFASEAGRSLVRKWLEDHETPPKLLKDMLASNAGRGLVRKWLESGEGVPHPLRNLFASNAGRGLVRKWLEQAEQQETPAAA